MAWPKGQSRKTVEEIPRGTVEEAIEKVKEVRKKDPQSDQEIINQSFPPRKFSEETDHKGAYHPLCHGCAHREDMHHSWQSEQVLQDYRDATGKVSQRLATIKHKVYDGPKPCQHACKCTEYK